MQLFLSGRASRVSSSWQPLLHVIGDSCRYLASADVTSRMRSSDLPANAPVVVCHSTLRPSAPSMALAKTDPGVSTRLFGTATEASIEASIRLKAVRMDERPRAGMDVGIGIEVHTYLEMQ